MKQVYNPYLPLYEYVPDGEPHIFDGRLYLYGSHDQAGGERYCTGDYVTWSAPIEDLTDWRYEGVIYRRVQDPANRDGKADMYAPDVVRGEDRRFYLYYCLSTQTLISVAVSETPTGPFDFYGYVRYPSNIKEGAILTDDMPFDPAVLVDDDGRVYLYYGFSPEKDLEIPSLEELITMGIPEKELREMREKESLFQFSRGGMVLELEQDMLTVKEEPHVCLPGGKQASGTDFEGHGFYEASSIRKIDGKYYYIYSSQLSHELCYAVSTHPMEGFTYGGTIVSNGDIGYDGRQMPVYPIGNNHGSIIQVNDRFYVFYHRHTHGIEYSRQGCAEKITILSDGSIRQAEITSCGLNVGALRAEGSYPAAIACHLTGPDMLDGIGSLMTRKQAAIVENSDMEGEREQYICQIANNTVIGFKYFRFGEAKEIQLSVRGKANGILLLSIDEEEREKIGSSDILLDSMEWKNHKISLAPLKGDYAVYVSFKGEGNFDWKDFTFIL